MTIRTSGVWAFGTIITAAMVSPAMAQDTSAPGAAGSETQAVGGGQTGEIIVTAQRREQTLQKVPVAVSTVNSAQIEARRLNNVDALSGIAPNLVVVAGNNSSSSTQIAIRGSVTTNNTINYDPAVGLYLDGVYSGKASGSVFDIGDLERVEVLRGPQGTLFGRNTLAGAISFVTRKPSDKLRIEGEATYGDYNYMAGRGLVNIPLTNTLFVKISGQFQKRDGFTKLVPDPQGVVPNTATGSADNRDRYSVMGQVRWKPTDGLTIDYSYDLSHTHENPLTALFDVTPGGILSFLEPYVLPNDNRPKTISLDHNTQDNSRVYGHTLTVFYDLGFATLKSISAYRNVYVNQGQNQEDLDGTPYAIGLGGFTYHYHQASQELQLTGNLWDQRVNYVVGGYYFDDNAKGYNPQSYFLGATNLITQLGEKTRAYAAYGQADFKVTDKLTVTGGLRWTSERKQVERLYQVVDSGGIHFDPPLTIFRVLYNGDCGADPTCASDVHHTFSNVSPTGIIAYQFTPDLNVYGKYSVGFRSGGFNADNGTLAGVTSYYKPEQNRSFEVGVKSRFFDRRLTVNVAGFFNTEKDKQLAIFQASQAASTINVNAGKGRVKGIEIEFDGRPIDAVHLYGSLGLLRTHFLKFEDTDISGDLVDVADNRYYPKSPRTTATAGADLRVYETEDHGHVTLSGDMLYQSKTFALTGQTNFDPAFPTVATGAQNQLPAVWQVNARLRWDDIPLGGSGLKGYAMLWVKNLTDYAKVNNKIEFGPNFGGLLDSNYMDPRTYGVTLGFKY